MGGLLSKAQGTWYKGIRAEDSAFLSRNNILVGWGVVAWSIWRHRKGMCHYPAFKCSCSGLIANIIIEAERKRLARKINHCGVFGRFYIQHGSVFEPLIGLFTDKHTRDPSLDRNPSISLALLLVGLQSVGDTIQLAS
jgi:hypothetical protein